MWWCGVVWPDNRKCDVGRALLFLLENFPAITVHITGLAGNTQTSLADLRENMAAPASIASPDRAGNVTQRHKHGTLEYWNIGTLEHWNI